MRSERAQQADLRRRQGPCRRGPQDWLQATDWRVRDRMVERWMTTTPADYAQDAKRVYYLSMEFLIGRTLGNALAALGLDAG